MRDKISNIGSRYIMAKRKLFDKANESLNSRQREAVFTTEGPLLVIAGAGSGKTTVLVRRIAQIIRYGNAYNTTNLPTDLSEQTVAALEGAIELAPDEILPILDEFTTDPCPPWNVLAITFTNKAANEIKTRLSSMFDNSEVAGNIWSGTFHSICMKILRKFGDRLGYSDNLTIYDADDTKKAIISVMRELNVDEKQFQPKNVAAEISSAKEKLLNPDEYAASAGKNYRENVYARVYSAYQARLHTSNALDFDDIIMQTVFLLRAEDDVRHYYAHKFRYISVDEYQDTNPAQFALCELFASEWHNIMVVGDDDQSIYKFRGATVENILSFDKVYNGAHVIKLEQNYRSTKNILKAANAVIAKNEHRHGKELWTDNTDGVKILLSECDDQNAEAKAIADIILRKVAEKKYRFKDFGVLYRVNAQSSVIERTFAKSAVPYRIFGGVRFGDRKEIKDIVAYLQLVSNHSDRVRLKRIINEPKRKIGDTTISAVEAIADETDMTMFSVMENAASYTALTRSASVLTDFTDMINEFNRILDGGCPLDAFVKTVLETTGYRKMLENAGEAEKDRVDNLDEFISGVIEYMNTNDEPTLQGFLEETALVADVDRYDENADAVVLMTIHSAKGLEFPVAILPGIEEGLFPGTKALLEPDELEEERRLAYVAITRAKKELYLLHTKNRMLYGHTMMNQVSRFVCDIPPELIDEAVGSSPRNSIRNTGVSDYSAHPRIYYSSTHTGAANQHVSTGDELTVNRPLIKTPTKTTVTAFKPGDRVRHMTFGEGEILSVKAMGADFLYEVMFDSAGTKRLMATYAKLSKV